VYHVAICPTYVDMFGKLKTTQCDILLIGKVSKFRYASASHYIPPSIFSPNLVSTLLLPLVVSLSSTYWFISLEFSTRHLHSIDSHTLSSNPIYKLTGSLVQTLPASNNSIHAFLIRHNHVDFCVLKLYSYYIIKVKVNRNTYKVP